MNHPSTTPLTTPVTTPVTGAATGHPLVDEATASLAVLDDVPVEGHVAVLESAHERLRAALSDAAGSTPTG